MQTTKLKSFITKQLEDNKALDIVALNVKKLSDSTDMMIIATGTSTRHVQSIAKKLIAALKEADARPLGVEGEEFGEWVLIDLGDLIVHVMLQSQRTMYNLEELWTATKKQRNTRVKSN